MIGEMAIKKVTVMKNDHSRKQERLGYSFALLVDFTRGVEGTAPIDVIGLGCLLTRVDSESECKG